MATGSIDEMLANAIDVDASEEEILLAATNHDIEALKKLFETNDAKVQDATTGFGPLHAAIASCEPDDEVDGETDKDGMGDAVTGVALGEDSALETVRLLFENGAIWNELDDNDETPGCLALRLGLHKIYEAIVAAGVRAELLFSKLDEYQPIPDDVGPDEGEGEAVVDGNILPVAGDSEQKAIDDLEQPQRATLEGASAVIVEDATRAGAASQTERDVQPHDTEPILSNPNVDNGAYLQSDLTYSGDRLLDSDKNAVMMDWETEIMKISADKLCRGEKGLRTMNVGHGMGIVDEMFLANDPAEHHIVEAHPQVITRMHEKGWFEKPNVIIHQGRWQDVLPQLVEQGLTLDAVYYDTYAEDYKDLKEFFDEYIIALLDSRGRFGFYNGLGADRQICYDVYTKVGTACVRSAGDVFALTCWLTGSGDPS